MREILPIALDSLGRPRRGRLRAGRGDTLEGRPPGPHHDPEGAGGVRRGLPRRCALGHRVLAGDGSPGEVTGTRRPGAGASRDTDPPALDLR